MTAAYDVRVSTPADKAAVTALLEASYPELLRPHYTPKMLAVALPLMTKANPALLASGSFFVAEMPDGQVIGCGGWTRAAPGGAEETAGAGHIRHFGTHPDFVRMGVARALIQRCIDEAAAAGLHTLECQSTLAAEKFYASAGFRRLALIDVPLSPEVHYPAVKMRRDLP